MMNQQLNRDLVILGDFNVASFDLLSCHLFEDILLFSLHRHRTREL